MALPRVHEVGQWTRYLGMIHALVIHAFYIEFHFWVIFDTNASVQYVQYLNNNKSVFFFYCFTNIHHCQHAHTVTVEAIIIISILDFAFH